MLNTSANVEKPQELKYDKKWSTRLNECLNLSSTPKSSKIPSSDLDNLYSNSTLITLPNRYSYDFVTQEKGFTEVPKDLETLFNIDNLSNFKIAKSPNIANKKAVFLIGYDESGQSKLYLLTLNSSFMPIDRLLLYDSEEADGEIISTTYEISEDYDIKIKKLKITGQGNNIKEKTLTIDQFVINQGGMFKKK